MNITFDSLLDAVNDKFQALKVDLPGDEVAVFENPVRREPAGRIRFQNNLDVIDAIYKDGKDDEVDEEKPEPTDEEIVAEAEAAEAALIAAYRGVLEDLCVSENFKVIEALLGKDAYVWTELFSNVMKNLKVGEA